jgi:hypothetical protein
MKGKLASITLLVLLLGTVLMSGCCGIRWVDRDGPRLGFGRRVRGSGDVVREERRVSDFDHVSLTGIGRVVLTQGESESLTVETDDNILPYIRTEVRGRTLVLGFNKRATGRSMDPSELTFHLQVREVSGLDLTGAGTLEADSLTCDRLQVHLSGAGHIAVDSLDAEELVVRLSGAGGLEVAGEVTEQDVDISGVGAYRGSRLQSERAVVEVSGAGGATVWVTETLNVRVSGVGSVDYYGSPSVTQNVSLVGKVASLGAR